MAESLVKSDRDFFAAQKVNGRLYCTVQSNRNSFSGLYCKRGLRFTVAGPKGDLGDGDEDAVDGSGLLMFLTLHITSYNIHLLYVLYIRRLAYGCLGSRVRSEPPTVEEP